MAVTQNTYTGNGSTTNYSFTFPYLETTDIKVSVNGTPTTAYTLANATTVSFNTAPANGAAIRIYRDTDDSALAATFYPGSAIRSSDLNNNFTQNLYVTQEVSNYAVQDIGSVTLSAAYTFNNAVTGATPTASSHLATKQYVDNVASAITSAGISDGAKGDVTVSGLGTVWSITSDSIVNADINSNAGISYSKLSLAGSVVNADINSSAAIAYSKLNLANSVGAGDISAAGIYTTTTTATSKTLANRERCTVTASGQTITLPASPAAGWEVSITIAGTFVDTTVDRNGSNIMSLAENMTLDKADATVTLYYVDATRGWRII